MSLFTLKSSRSLTLFSLCWSVSISVCLSRDVTSHSCWTRAMICCVASSMLRSSLITVIPTVRAMRSSSDVYCSHQHTDTHTHRHADTQTHTRNVTKQYNLVPADRRWRYAAGKVTAGLAESNGSLPPGGWLQVTCGLTACTSGSAPGSTLSNEYERTLPFTIYLSSNADCFSESPQNFPFLPIIS